MKRQRTKRNRFAKGMMLLWTLGMAVIAVALGWIWFALDRYESATPEAAVRHYLQQIRQEKWEAVLTASGFTPTDLTGEAEYTAYLKELYSDLPEEPRLVRTGEDGGSVYQLCAEDGTQIARLELTPAPEGEKYAYQVRTRLQYLDPVIVEAPQGVQLLVNGKPMPETAVQGSADAKGYEGLPEGVSAPQQLRYELSGLLSMPKISVADEHQTSCQVSGPDSEGENSFFRVTRLIPEQNQKEASELALNAAKTYAAFVTADASRTELNAFLLRGSTFYQSMQQFYNGWYVEHTGHEYRSVVCDELQSAGENAFSARVSFDYVVLRDAKEYVYPSSYRLYFIKTESGWKLAQLDTL